MTTTELITLLETFIKLPGENEVIEFKKAQNGFDTQKIGEYFSALSNEANLHQEEYAWLLFGIHDKTHAVTGSSYKPTRPSLDALKREIAEGTTSHHHRKVIKHRICQHFSKTPRPHFSRSRSLE